MSRPVVVPMVRETVLPRRPPVVELKPDSNASARGVRYTTDFRLRGATTTAAPEWPVPWPVPIVTRSRTATLVVHSTGIPDDVLVKSWRALIPDGHRVPNPHQAAPAYECQRFAAPTCRFERRSGELRLVVPLRGPFVAVYLQWHIPHSQQLTGSMASDDASATWLFRFEGGSA